MAPERDPKGFGTFEKQAPDTRIACMKECNDETANLCRFPKLLFPMVRNIGHARVDGTANETKNMSHNTFNHRDLIMKTALKAQIVHWKSLSTKRNP